MPNGGTYHCGHCRHLDSNRCTLRDVPIADTHYTSCISWNADTETAYGPLLAMVAEVKKGGAAT